MMAAFKLMKLFYYLEGRRPVLAKDVMEWRRKFKAQDRTVAHTRITKDDSKDREVRVSTVFLGIDHAFGPGGPILFESMVFGGPLHGEQERYHTWEEAVAGHEAMVQRVWEAL